VMDDEALCAIADWMKLPASMRDIVRNFMTVLLVEVLFSSSAIPRRLLIKRQAAQAVETTTCPFACIIR
jgi:hypothetical protein